MRSRTCIRLIALMLIATSGTHSRSARAAPGMAQARRTPCSTAYAALTSRPSPTNAQIPVSPALRAKLDEAAETLRRSVAASAGQPVLNDPKLWSEVQTLQRELDVRRDALVQARAERRRLREIVTAPERKDSPVPSQVLSALRARKVNTDRLVERLGYEIDALSRAIGPMRERVGLGVFNSAGQETARRANAIIAVRRIHPAAAGHMTDRAVAKTMDFKFNSAEDGVIAGLVPYDQSLSGKVRRGGAALLAKRQRQVEEAISKGTVEAVEYRIGTLVAVRQGDTVVFKDEFRDQVARDQVVKILVDKQPTEEAVRVLRSPGPENGLITSDIDTVFFLFGHGEPGTVRTSPRMGTLADRERETIGDFNARAQRLLGRAKNDRRYITHGPEAHNPDSEGLTGSFTVYMPDGRIETILEGPPGDTDLYLREFYKRARATGYDGAVHPNWGWR